MKWIFVIWALMGLQVLGSPRAFKKTDYKSFFGQCPSQVAGKLTLELIDVFEKNRSLKDIKQHIVKEKLKEKFFLQSYNISYTPLKNRLTFNYQCPTPIMKVQIYKTNGEEFYTAILGDNGQLLDPTYEVLLRSEKTLTGKLPDLAMSVEVLDTKLHEELADLMAHMDVDLKKKISEVIISEKDELTVILSLKNKASSVFFGKDYWDEKLKKLERLVKFMHKKPNSPKVINLTNSKKVVVKF